MRFGLDVVSLLTLGLGGISDREVLRRARSSGRVIVTLDEDFVQPYSGTGQVTQGIIYLDLPNSRRYISDIQHALGTFLEHHAAGINLDRAIVILYEERVEIRRS